MIQLARLVPWSFVVGCRREPWVIYFLTTLLQLQWLNFMYFAFRMKRLRAFQVLEYPLEVTVEGIPSHLLQKKRAAGLLPTNIRYFTVP